MVLDPDVVQQAHSLAAWASRKHPTGYTPLSIFPSEITSDSHDVTSTMLDVIGSLGPFRDATMAGLGNTVTPSEDTVTPVSSPQSRESYDINDGYIEFTDEFVEEF